MLRMLGFLFCASLVMPAQALAQCSSDPLRPIMRSRVMPPNPGHVTGITTLEVHIGVDGVPDSAKIIHYTHSSGSLQARKSDVTPEMDELARRYVMNYWRWQMPTFNCEVRAVSTRVNVNWK